jgi:hypothetical protein
MRGSIRRGLKTPVEKCYGETRIRLHPPTSDSLATSQDAAGSRPAGTTLRMPDPAFCKKKVANFLLLSVRPALGHIVLP